MGLQIPYVDLVRQHTPLREALLAAVAAVIDRGDFIAGREVELFERRLADLCGVRHAVAMNSGTDALMLGLRALGIGPGDEVITVPNSYIASASSIALVGARPVFVDVRRDFNLDPDRLEAARTPRTRAVMPVHLTGRPADMDAILAWARHHRLAVLEDCAQAVLAAQGGRCVGSLGDIGCFSLHPLKTLNACGDGGVATTNDDDLAGRLRLLRNQGLATRDDCRTWSLNSRLDTIQAAMLLVKADHLERWTERRRENARWYRQALAGVTEVWSPEEREGERAVYHTFVVEAERRDELKAHLERDGVGTAIHYPVPLHLQKAAEDLGYAPGSFPVAERQATRILSLPIYPELSRADIEHVAASIRDFYSRNRP
jgi:dTDP-4-amino-4,6-dideoxygalactose transaminase